MKGIQMMKLIIWGEFRRILERELWRLAFQGMQTLSMPHEQLLGQLD